MLETFKNLSEDEVYKFSKFVNSPYHSTNKQIIRLFDYLNSKYPVIKNSDISKAAISEFVFPDTNYNDGNVRKLISDFDRVYENFLIQTELDKETQRSKLLLLKSLRQRRITKRYESLFKEVNSFQEKEFSKDTEFYLNQIKLENENYYYNLDSFKTEYAKCLQSKSDNIDFNFIFSKLHTFHEMLNNQNSSNKILPFKKTFSNEIFDYIDKNKSVIISRHPNIYIIYLQIMMFSTLRDEYLKELLNFLKANENKFCETNLSYYYNYIVSYYLMKINSGDVKYRNDLFNTYKIMLEKDLFLIDNIITDMEFNGVVNNVLALNQYKWVDNFIETYKYYLEEVSSKDAYNLAKAKVYFYRKEYSKTFTFLNNVVYKTPQYYMNSKFLLAKVYFETKNIKEIYYLKENLKQYLRKKNILTNEQILVIKTFIIYISELVRIHEIISKNKESLKFIFKKQLDNEKKFVSNKSWFYEKIEEL